MGEFLVKIEFCLSMIYLKNLSQDAPLFTNNRTFFSRNLFAKSEVGLLREPGLNSKLLHFEMSSIFILIKFFNSIIHAYEYFRNSSIRFLDNLLNLSASSRKRIFGIE